jgi:hypothetical protein
MTMVSEYIAGYLDSKAMFGWSNLGLSYKHPQNKFGSNKAKTFFAGSENFQLDKIKIFLKE